MSESEWLARIGNSQRNRDMLALREQGLKFREIGERYGLSTNRAQQIVSKQIRIRDYGRSQEKFVSGQWPREDRYVVYKDYEIFRHFGKWHAVHSECDGIVPPKHFENMGYVELLKAIDASEKDQPQ